MKSKKNLLADNRCVLYTLLVHISKLAHDGKKKKNSYITFVFDTVKYKLFMRKKKKKRKERKFRLSPSIILRQNFVSSD